MHVIRSFNVFLGDTEHHVDKLHAGCCYEDWISITWIVAQATELMDIFYNVYLAEREATRCLGLAYLDQTHAPS